MLGLTIGEQPVGRYVIDIVIPQRLVEIQTRNFASMVLTELQSTLCAWCIHCREMACQAGSRSAYRREPPQIAKRFAVEPLCRVVSFPADQSSKLLLETCSSVRKNCAAKRAKPAARGW